MNILHFCVTWVIFQPFRRRDVKRCKGFPCYFSFTQSYIPSYSKTSWKNETKIILLWSRINAKNWVFVVPYHISWQRIVIRCVVTVDYGHFSCRHRPGIVLPKQNVYVNELNIVLLHAFRSDEFTIVTRKWTKSGLYFTDILHVTCTKWHLANEDCQCL